MSCFLTTLWEECTKRRLSYDASCKFILWCEIQDQVSSSESYHGLKFTLSHGKAVWGHCGQRHKHISLHRHTGVSLLDLLFRNPQHTPVNPPTTPPTHPRIHQSPSQLVPHRQTRTLSPRPNSCPHSTLHANKHIIFPHPCQPASKQISCNTNRVQESINQST